MQKTASHSSEIFSYQFSEAIPVGTYIMKVDSPGVATFTFLSKRFLEMLNLDREKALVDPYYVYSIVHPDDYQNLMETADHVQRNGLPFYWEGRMIVKGEVRWFLCETSSRRQSDGSLIHEGAVTDITKQKNIELQLQHSLDQSIQLLKNIPHPMVINDSHSKRIIYINNAFTELFGYSADDIPLVSDWARLAYPDEEYRKEVFDWWYQVIENHINNGDVIPKKVFYIRTKSGEYLHVVISGSLLNDQLILTFADVTESEKEKQYIKQVQEQKVRDVLLKIEQTQNQMLHSLIALAKERDNETGNHIVRTKEYVKIIANRLRLSGHYEDQLTDFKMKNIVDATPLHDIGKVGIPDAILKKPGKLTQDEWSIMQTHTLIGEKVLQTAEGHDSSHHEVLFTARLIAGGHHEKWDGSGYPRGLKGDEIPLAARIMSIADMYDALISRRVYKSEWTHEKAVREITSMRGSHFDPLVVDAFIAEVDQFQIIANQYLDDA